MSLFETLRKPEHTGETRCWPCTAVNSAFVLGVAGLVGRRWKPAGLAVLVLGAAAIGLRGYVVPYTPQFAPRLVEQLPVDFGHDSPSSDSFSEITIERTAETEPSSKLAANGTDEVATSDDAATDGNEAAASLPDSDSLTALDADGAQVMGALLEAGIIVDDGETVAPTDEFTEKWESAMAELRGLDDEKLAQAVAAAAPFEAEGTVDDDWVVVEGEGQAIHLTRPIAIAETAAVQVMTEAGVSESVRVDAAQPLRMFLERCPSCGGVVEETNSKNCCGGSQGAYGGVVYDVLACAECGALVYEFDETVED